MTESMTAYFERTASVLEELASDPPGELDQLVDAILSAWDRGGKIVSCGNGGSAADSQHFTTELVARFDEKPIHRPALCLTTNSPTLTAVSNDWSFKEVFARQVRAQVTQKDVFLGISTSGNSENVLRAIETASQMGASSFGLTGTPLGDLEDIDCSVIAVPCDHTPRIQEAHTACLHYVCSEIDRRLNQ